MTSRLFPLFGLFTLALLAGCSMPRQDTAPSPEASTADATPPPAQATVATRPFPQDALYALLVAEIAGQRRLYDVALGNYLLTAHKTEDPGVAKRAAQLATVLRAEAAALDAYVLWARLDPDNPEARFNAAVLLAQAGRPQEAFEHMQAVLRKGGAANFSAIAASALKLPPDEQATLLERYEELIHQHPEDNQLQLGKALLLQQKGEHDAALDALRHVLKRDPENLQAVIIEAKLLQDMDKGDAAYKRIQTLLNKNPANAKLRLQYARLLVADDMSRAQEQFALLVQQSPDDVDLIFSLALISKETGKLDEARQQFQRLLDKGERTSTAHHYLGQIAQEKGDAVTAVEHYRQVAPGPDFMPATARLTQLLADTGNLDEARATLAELRDSYPLESTRLTLLESDLLVKRKQFRAAHHLLSEGLAEAPNNTAFLYARAMVSEKRSDLTAMEEDLRRVMALEPNNATALNALGYVLADQTSRLQEALTLITRALQLRPQDPAILDSMGWVLFKLGRTAEAVDYLERAWDGMRDEEVAAHLGEAQWVNGNKERAERVWRRGQKINPASEKLREVVRRYLGRDKVEED